MYLVLLCFGALKGPLFSEGQWRRSDSGGVEEVGGLGGLERGNQDVLYGRINFRKEKVLEV